MGAIIKDLKLTEAGGSATEIVTVSDVKDYLQIEGTAYDGPIAIFITAARQMIENICSVSLMEKTAILTTQTNSYKPFKLQGYPVDAISSVIFKQHLTEDEILVLDYGYSVFGNSAKWIDTGLTGLHEVTYSLGVDGRNVFVQAVQAQAAFMFNNRDAKPGAVAPEVQALLSSFFEIS